MDKAKHFNVRFAAGHTVPAVIVPRTADPHWLKAEIGLPNVPRPTLFITGGASGMTPEDMTLTGQIIADGIVRFAERFDVVVIDGGTESGVMKMIGDAHMERKCRFPLIGVAPNGRVGYQGHPNPNKEADLEDGHTHFVLVEGDNWGDESETIVRLAYAITGDGQKRSLGVLVNGGKIARQDVYVATTKDMKVPILVLEGSGRFADELATATKTGEADETMVRAIIERGDIHLLNTRAGAKGMFDRLCHHFGLQP